MMWFLLIQFVVMYPAPIVIYDFDKTLTDIDLSRDGWQKLEQHIFGNVMDGRRESLKNHLQNLKNLGAELWIVSLNEKKLIVESLKTHGLFPYFFQHGILGAEEIAKFRKLSDRNLKKGVIDNIAQNRKKFVGGPVFFVDDSDLNFVDLDCEQIVCVEVEYDEDNIKSGLNLEKMNEIETLMQEMKQNDHKRF